MNLSHARPFLAACWDIKIARELPNFLLDGIYTPRKLTELAYLKLYYGAYYLAKILFCFSIITSVFKGSAAAKNPV